MIDAQQQVERFRDFIAAIYEKDFHELIRKGTKSLLVNFSELLSFDAELADALLDEPEELMKAADLSLTHFELPEKILVRVRWYNLSDSQRIKIKDIRSANLNYFAKVEGIVRQSSDVRPQVTSAKFECPSCGNMITILQLDTKFKEPFRCSCGRKGKFRLISKELVDAQRIVLEESPESLDGGEQPKRLTVFLKEDLVEPKMEKKTTPGSRVRVTGIIKEVPIVLSSGTQSIRYDLMMDANFIEPVEEVFEEMEVNKEEEEQVKALSRDPRIYERFANSIAPSIYGHQDVKEALVLQLFGGVRKVKSDGTRNRGDLHILLVGDPGCISGDSQVAIINKGMKRISTIGKVHGENIKERVTKIRKNPQDKEYDIATVFQHYKQQPVLKVTTESGKEVICTYNQPFLTKKGWERADSLSLGTPIRVMPKIPTRVNSLANTEFKRVEKKTGHLKEVYLPNKFTPELASLCGYIIGDGNVHPRGYSITCYVNNEEQDLIPMLTEFWKNTFQIEPSLISISPKNGYTTIDDGNGVIRQIVRTQQLHLLEIHSRQVAPSLAFLSVKRVPQQIFQSPKPVIAKFISWLFEADGCAFANGRGRTSIQLKSATPKLLADVQILLLYFGIHSRIIEQNLGIRRSYDMELFAKEIGFNSLKKKKALQHVLEETARRSEIQKRKVQRYEKVTEIVQAGIRDVYDFEVPKTHMFIANGIVCHNSGKSQTLQFIVKAAPKARFVSGKGASAAGITASVVKDEFLRGWALEAGAMVLANKGICVVDELDKMTPEDRDALHEAMEQQCMLPDFKLTLANGRSVKIGEFVDGIIKKNKNQVYSGRNCEILPVSGISLISTDFKKHFPKKVARVSRHIATKVFTKIELANGREITVTPEHPCWIVNDGNLTTIPAENLKEGMFFPIPSKIEIKTKKYSVRNDYLCKIIGYHVSDGSYELNRGKKTGIQFWNNNPILIEDYKRAIKNYFRISPIITRRREQFSVRVISKKVVFELRKLDNDLLEKGNIKKIPEEIMQLPTKNLKYLLRALYDGDGSVGVLNRNGCRVSFVSQNRILVEQIADLLLRFSIISSIFKDRTSAVWRLDITGQNNLTCFAKEINFLSKHKRERLNRYCKSKKSYKTVTDIIPSCTEKINYIFRALDIHPKKELGHQIDLGVEKQRVFLQKLVSIAQKKVKQLHKEKQFEHDLVELERLAFGYARWSKIKKVSNIKNKNIHWVYDVTIEPHHTFVSNGMILHNTITIAKANIHATLNAETTILAAANPKMGRFDPYQPIAAQIDLPSTLINRFDLIFPIRDLPNKEMDTKIATHVLKLQQSPEMLKQEIDTPMMKKYISYAKQKIFPVLSDAAIDEIKTFYVTLRNKGTTGDTIKPIPISARQLEALVRLSEGSARVRLSQKVTREDAKRAIALLQHCLMQVGFDYETGEIDIDRIATGVPASERSRISLIREIFTTLENKGMKQIPIEEIIALAAEKGIKEEQVEEAIQRLSRDGSIFEPRRGFFSKI